MVGGRVHFQCVQQTHLHGVFSMEEENTEAVLREEGILEAI